MNQQAAQFLGLPPTISRAHGFVASSEAGLRRHPGAAATWVPWEMGTTCRIPKVLGRKLGIPLYTGNHLLDASVLGDFPHTLPIEAASKGNPACIPPLHEYEGVPFKRELLD